MPICPSLLHNDWYKFTMPPVVQRHCPRTMVRCGFTNRNTDFPLAHYVDLAELTDELDALRDLRFSSSELAYLSSLGAIDPDYLEQLSYFRMPEVHFEVRGDQLAVWVEGLWEDIMPAEIPVLQIITELVSRRLAKDMGLTPADIRQVGYRHLDEFAMLMLRNPSKSVSLFGTRRHYSHQWEYEATAYMVRRFGRQIAGISNVALAREFGYPVKGTIAHEYIIVPTMMAIAQGIENPIGFAQNQGMDFWEAEYGNVWNGGMLCAIPDTYGTDCFLRNFTPERAEIWRAFKQDSGDPIDEIKKIVGWLRRNNMNPADYLIAATDGLDVKLLDKLFRYADAHRGDYRDAYGPGTMTSNRVGVPTHSLVWKPQEVLVDGVWVPCVKLSNNKSKVVCNDPKWLARIQHLAAWDATYNVPQVV